MADVQLSTLGLVVKTAYEGQTNTNAFTDAEKTKLAGVEAGASADQTGAEIVSSIDTELGGTAWQTGGGGGGIAWSDPVDADIVPDTDGTRDVGTAANRFAEGHFDAVFIGTTQLDGTTLAAPVADRIIGYDLSAATVAYFTPGSGLSITGTDLNAEVSLVGAETLTNKTLTNPKVTFAASAQGTKTTGTFTPDPADGSMQTATNGGAHTLGVPASDCSLAVLYTNNGSAGAITTSAYSMVTGDALTTTDTQAFMFYIIRIGAVSHLNVVAMQ